MEEEVEIQIIIITPLSIIVQYGLNFILQNAC